LGKVKDTATPIPNKQNNTDTTVAYRFDLYLMARFPFLAWIILRCRQRSVTLVGVCAPHVRPTTMRVERIKFGKMLPYLHMPCKGSQRQVFAKSRKASIGRTAWRFGTLHA
jgi:hypothetical protein